MTRLLTLSPLALLLILLTMIMSACSPTGQSNAAPTPAGLPQGKPTFVYLWTFP